MAVLHIEMKKFSGASDVSDDLPILRLLQEAVLSLCRKNYPNSPGLEVDAIICISMLKSTQHHVVKIHEKICSDTSTDEDECHVDENSSKRGSNDYIAVSDDEDVPPPECMHSADAIIHSKEYTHHPTNSNCEFDFGLNMKNKRTDKLHNFVCDSEQFAAVKNEPADNHIYIESCAVNRGIGKPVTDLNIISLMKNKAFGDAGVLSTQGNTSQMHFKPNRLKSMDFEETFQTNEDETQNTEYPTAKSLVRTTIKQEPHSDTEISNKIVDSFEKRKGDNHDTDGGYHQFQCENVGEQNSSLHSNKKLKISGSNYYGSSFPDEELCRETSYDVCTESTDETFSENVTHKSYTCNERSVVTDILEQEKGSVSNLRQEDLSDENLSDIIHSGLEEECSETAIPHIATQEASGYRNGHMYHVIPNSRSVYHEKKYTKQFSSSSYNLPDQIPSQIQKTDPTEAYVSEDYSSQAMDLDTPSQMSIAPMRTTWHSVAPKPPSKMKSGTMYGKNLSSKERKFFCKSCGAGFTELYNKMRHEKTTCGVMCYKCRMCNHTFSRSDSMARHMQQVHGVSKTMACIANGNFPLTDSSYSYPMSQTANMV
ncbi:hypothetical protein ScPMuIL_010662 [Solemya velum]